MKRAVVASVLAGLVFPAFSQSVSSGQESEGNANAVAPVNKSVENPTIELKVPKYVPVLTYESNGQFYKVIGEVHCTDNTYFPREVVNKYCVQRDRTGGGGFVDKLNPARQNAEFNPRIEQADAILYDLSMATTASPKGGIGTMFLSMLQYGGRDLVSVDAPGVAVKWTEPTTEDFERILSKQVERDKYSKLLRSVLMKQIREKKLVEHAKKLYVFLPEPTGASIQEWARSSDNLLAFEILASFKDPAAIALAPGLEKVLRYSNDDRVRLSCARLLIKLNRQDVIEAVAKDAAPSMRSSLNQLLLES